MQENNYDANTADQALVDNEYKAEMDRALVGAAAIETMEGITLTDRPAKLTAAEAVAKYADRVKNFRPQGDLIKAGDYVPMVILVVQNGQSIMNYHLPQKLFALKDFSQTEVMHEYIFEHPHQVPMLNPQQPDPASFNSAAANFHKWLVKKGYCEDQGATNLPVHVWSDEEIKAAQAEEKAKREAEAAQAPALNHIDDVAFIQDPVVGSVGDPRVDPELNREIVTPTAPVVDINNIDAVGGKGE